MTLPNFIMLRQEVCELSAVGTFCSWKSGPKFTKIS